MHNYVQYKSSTTTIVTYIIIILLHNTNSIPNYYLLSSYVALTCTIGSNITHLLLLTSFISSLLYFLGQLLSSSYPTTTNFMSSIALRCTINFHANNTKYVYFIFHFSSKFPFPNYPQIIIIFT
ncbi:hypothetical protein PFMALIP_01610 [Plasmodium falciparum MaliPS096_E11]|uniref:Uncharacterized protein n=1 Tax=Plasmodium falciparum MaliPS096_E11 TaxID=1036727 RepID=A0A024WT40_PLAFA|nr:hypothetical protein PFMALIP_01610 [Plasmodium falciparum MaliPS096_E11]